MSVAPRQARPAHVTTTRSSRRRAWVAILAVMILGASPSVADSTPAFATLTMTVTPTPAAPGQPLAVTITGAQWGGLFCRVDDAPFAEVQLYLDMVTDNDFFQFIGPRKAFRFDPDLEDTITVVSDPLPEWLPDSQYSVSAVCLPNGNWESNPPIIGRGTVEPFRIYPGAIQDQAEGNEDNEPTIALSPQPRATAATTMFFFISESTGDGRNGVSLALQGYLPNRLGGISLQLLKPDQVREITPIYSLNDAFLTFIDIPDNLSDGQWVLEAEANVDCRRPGDLNPLPCRVDTQTVVTVEEGVISAMGKTLDTPSPRSDFLLSIVALIASGVGILIVLFAVIFIARARATLSRESGPAGGI